MTSCFPVAHEIQNRIPDLKVLTDKNLKQSAPVDHVPDVDYSNTVNQSNTAELFSDGNTVDDGSEEDDNSSDKNVLHDSETFESISQSVTLPFNDNVKELNINQLPENNSSYFETNRLDFQSYQTASYFKRNVPDKNRKLYPAKIPNIMRLASSSFCEETERQTSLSECSTFNEDNKPLNNFDRHDNDRTIRWRETKKNQAGELNLDDNNHPFHESNTNFVQWSDGSWTLVIGETYYDCQIQPDRCFLLDGTDPNLLISHAVLSEKITLRPCAVAGHIVNKQSTTTRTLRPKSTQLTTTTDAITAEISARNRFDHLQSQHASRIKQRCSSAPKGMDAKFLEEENEDD